MATILERNKKVAPHKKTREEHAEDALYREVWEEVNNEKTQRFIKKYWRHMAAAAIGLLICVTAIQIGINIRNSHRMAMAVNYETAIQNVDAAALASVGENASGGTADLAMFQSYMISGDMKTLEKLATSGNTRDFRDLAKLHYIAHNGDEMSAQDVKKYLSELDTKKSPFYYTAALTVAQKYLSVGDTENANKYLDKIINDSDAPAVISATAQELR